MKERPILFKGEMVRALLNGSKTQTRRVVKQLDPALGACTKAFSGKEMPVCWAYGGPVIYCPYGQPGDRLWVRETFMDLQGTGVEYRDSSGKMQRYAYASECLPGSYGDYARQDYGLKWKPSIHMPRAASRILLEIVSVRVERLNECSEADARAEGVKLSQRAVSSTKSVTCYWDYLRDQPEYSSARSSYASLWESINGAGSWAANPWVWVVTFRRIDP